MAKQQYRNRIELLQGTLDLMILQTLQWGPQHGYGISVAIRNRSGEMLQVPVPEIDDTAKKLGSQQTLEEAERAHILATLKKTRWVMSGPRGAATRLGVKRSSLQHRLKKLGIERPAEDDEATH